MALRTALLTLAAALTLAAGVEARDPVENAPHLRPAQASDNALVTEAVRRSPTVRDLLATLEKSNVVAYVAIADGIPFGPDSSIEFVGRSKAQRFVLIKVRDDASLDQRVSRVAHELQHAAEMAKATWVVDQIALQQMFKVIGWADPSAAPRFETTAACQAGHRAKAELRATAAAQPQQ